VSHIGLYNLGLYDFAGSGPVHIASGFSALAWSMMLGPRIADSTAQDRKQRAIHYKPHSPLLMCIGTCFIWFGWFAFNGASTANLSLRSIYVVVNTNLAACGGGITWVLLDYFYKKKFSLVGFCSGIIAGLVGITPAAGYGTYPFWFRLLVVSKQWLTHAPNSPCLCGLPRRRSYRHLFILRRPVQVPTFRRRRP